MDYKILLDEQLHVTANSFASQWNKDDDFNNIGVASASNNRIEQAKDFAGIEVTAAILTTFSDVSLGVISNALYDFIRMRFPRSSMTALQSLTVETADGSQASIKTDTDKNISVKHFHNVDGSVTFLIKVKSA